MMCMHVQVFCRMALGQSELRSGHYRPNVCIVDILPVTDKKVAWNATNLCKQNGSMVG